MDIKEAKTLLENIEGNVSSVIVGKKSTVRLLLVAMVSSGHVLLEDLPGTGKTMLAKSLAHSIDSVFSRIQFTPDLLPSDVTGLNYFSQKEGEFVFRKGPVFSSILLADEINRATPRTQSSLLECMEERQVTVDGETRTLPEPFLVIATQNPIETAGTYPLPEAQLDRFFMMLSMGLPSEEEEVEILSRFMGSSPLDAVKPVCTSEDILEMKKTAERIYVHPELLAYMAALAAATRNGEDANVGISVRGTLSLLRASRSYALLEGRDYVVPEDIKRVAVPVLAHRISTGSGNLDRRSGAKLIEKVLATVAVPTEDWGARAC